MTKKQDTDAQLDLFPVPKAGPPPLKYVHDADYEVFFDIDRRLAKRLFGQAAAYYFLDQTVLRENLRTEEPEESVRKLLDQFQPVYEWWNRGGKDRLLTIWWGLYPTAFVTREPEEPIWLAIGSSNGRLCDRLGKIMRSIGPRAVVGVESGPPPVERLDLIETLLHGTVYRFKPADCHDIDVALISQELIGIGGL